jgi:hypothetical protein
MINKNELRYGNLVYTWDTDYEYGPGNQFLQQVEEVRKNVVEFKTSHAAYYEIEPIPLTVEWMAKLGFEWNATDKRYYIQIGNILYLEFDTDFDCFIAPESWAGSCPWNNVKHVHQLQNLYFNLTGNELEIKI